MTKLATTKLQIVSGDPRPIFKQIVDGLRMEIACGDLPTGSKLPSVRGLAMQLTINPNTVAKAYTELTNQGLLESRKGLGLFVAQPRQQYSEQEQQVRLEKAIGNFINEVAYLDFSKHSILQELEVALAKIENANLHSSQNDKDI